MIARTSVHITDGSLLNRYATTRDQAAFAELVDRHGGMVLAAARRLAPMDADDVTQAVFLLLSTKAAALTDHPTLAGWLHETTRFCAANARRSRARRSKREAEAYVMNDAASAVTQQVDPAILAVLDDGVSRLPDAYSQVILLRYLEGLDVQEAADRLRVSPAAVVKRSTRALEKLRDFFARQGVTVSTGALTGCLATQVTPLPPVLQATIAGGHVASATAQTLATAARRSMTLFKVKAVTVIVGLITAGVGVTWGVAAGIAHFDSNDVPNYAPVPAVAAPAATPTPQDASRAEALTFLTALQKADTAAVAAELALDPPAAQKTAATYVADYAKGYYARFPLRLATITNWMTSVDQAGHPTLASFDVATPIDADASHLSLDLKPVDGKWKVSDVRFVSLDAASQKSTVDDLAAAAPAPPIAAVTAWRDFNVGLSKDPSTLQPADVPGFIAGLQKAPADLRAFETALKGTPWHVQPTDIEALANAMQKLADFMQQHGTNGLTDFANQLRHDSTIAKSMTRVYGVGIQLQTAADASHESHHTASRPVSREPDMTMLVENTGEKIQIPGPLKFPEWLRSTNAYQRWQTQRDIKTFRTTDDAGNRYEVACQGFVREADGREHELISQIRMYRPDHTLAAVTFCGPDGEALAWKILDATGTRFVWDIDTRGSETDPKKRRLDRVTRFDADGNEPSGIIFQTRTSRAWK